MARTKSQPAPQHISPVAAAKPVVTLTAASNSSVSSWLAARAGDAVETGYAAAGELAGAFAAGSTVYDARRQLSEISRTTRALRELEALAAELGIELRLE